MIKRLRERNVGCKIGSNYMGVFGYADDLSLLCPTLSGIEYMLQICEEYADEHRILFNAKKSKLLTFKSSCHSTITENMLHMKNGVPIETVNECKHLGSTVHTDISNKSIGNAINDIFMRTNNLMSDFSHCNSSTLSILHNTYCMSIYGSQLWRYNDNKSVEKFYIAWRKTIRRIWHIPSRTHNILLHHINGCSPINIMMEKRCIKFIWNLFNSNYNLHAKIVRGSVYNMGSTLAENMRYFMYKYNILYDDWSKPLCHILRKIIVYTDVHNSVDNICTCNAIIDLCNERDEHSSRSDIKADLNAFISMLCTD